VRTYLACSLPCTCQLGPLSHPSVVCKPLSADCFTMPHVVHAVVGAIAICAFAVLAFAFSMGEMEVRGGVSYEG
jgi:hypothetical protein